MFIGHPRLCHIEVGLFFLISLFGCSHESANVVSPTSEIIETQNSGLVPSTILSPSPVVAQAYFPESTVKPSLDRTSVPISDPLHFTFPTSAAELVSIWRPPLYPVPWEPTPNDHFYFIRPIGVDQVNWPLARYRYGGLLYAEPHTGIDIPTPKGTSILAAGPGEVIWSGYGLYFLRNEYQDPYGIAVAIKHDFGYQGKILYSIYGHMDESFVWRGQRVQSGDVIGKVGETGKTSGPHLHFEVRIGDNVLFGTRNPELWISPPQGYGIMVGRIMESSNEMSYQTKVTLVSLASSMTYEVMTYAKGAVNPDTYYKENVVMGDLPAGLYDVYLDLKGNTTKSLIEIKPGMVAFFSYDRNDGFTYLPPSSISFIPPDLTPTASP